MKFAIMGFMANKFPHILRQLALSIVSILCVVVWSGKQCAAQYDYDYLSYEEFYQGLAPYGQWIEDQKLGYVWSPGVDNGFRPYYTNGHWVMTEYGNTWVSDYTWGWACFHYGRWTYDPYYGWLWIPGNYWGPAWVSWRYGEGFYGWAPLGPEYQSTMTLTDYNCPEDWWVFIPPQYLYSGKYYQYWYGPRDNGKIITNTTVINNTYRDRNVTYITGPHVAQVKQVTGNTVQVMKVRNSSNVNTRVHNDVVRMYRPSEIRPASPMGGQAAPPPDVMTAPRKLESPQAVSNNTEQTPPFRAEINSRNADKAPIPGTAINKVAEPTRTTKRTDNNPYEWDVNRPIKQEAVRPAAAPRNSPPAAAPPQRQQPTAPREQAPARQQSAPTNNNTNRR